MITMCFRMTVLHLATNSLALHCSRSPTPRTGCDSAKNLPEAGARAREPFSLEAETSRCRQRQAACPPLAMPALYQATTDDLYKLCEASLARGLVASKRLMM